MASVARDEKCGLRPNFKLGGLPIGAGIQSKELARIAVGFEKTLDGKLEFCFKGVSDEVLSNAKTLRSFNSKIVVIEVKIDKNYNYKELLMGINEFRRSKNISEKGVYLSLKGFEGVDESWDLNRHIELIYMLVPNAWIICVGIPISKTLSILDSYWSIYKIFGGGLKYNLFNRPVLVASLLRSEDGFSDFYTLDVLGGSKPFDFVQLNREMSKFQFNAFSLVSNEAWQGYFSESFSDTVRSTRLTPQDFGPAFELDSIFPLDTVLVDPISEEVLFKRSIKTLLQRDQYRRSPSELGGDNSINDRIKQEFDMLPGYRISNSHFRLTSGVHTDRFYYAKLLFQSSYYSSRLSWLVSANFFPEMRPEEGIKAERLALIGYGTYSELLLSQVRDRLVEKAALRRENIHINMVMDDGSYNLARELPTEIERYDIQIIIPIATTLSTSIRIQNKLLKHKKIEQQNWRDRHPINVFLVLDQEKFSDGKSLYQKFGWTKISDREVETNSGIQYFYLPLPAELHASGTKCQLCFPVNELEERAGFKTQVDSTTPILVQGFPSVRKLEGREMSLNLRDCFTYEPIEVNGKLSLSYLNTVKLLRSERVKVEQWLDEIKAHDRIESFIEHFRSANPIVLIAPSHDSSIEIAEIVNERLFGSEAYVLHYDPEKEYLKNADLHHHDMLAHPRSRIIFVDDAVKTGSHFIRMHRFVHSCREMASDQLGREVIGAAFFLTNQSNKEIWDWLQKIYFSTCKPFTFLDLNNASTVDIDHSDILEKEGSRYDRLECMSNLNVTADRFRKNKRKVSLDEKRNLSRSEAQLFRNRSYDRIVTTHRLIGFFSENNSCIDASLDSWIDTLFASRSGLVSSIVQEYRSAVRVDNAEITANLKTHLRDTVLKVICQSPFNSYKPLREKALQWALNIAVDLFDETSRLLKKR